MKSYNSLCRLHLISFSAPSLSILFLASVCKPEAFLIERLQGRYLWSTQCSVDGGDKEGCLPWSTKWRKLPGPSNTDFQLVFWCQPHTLVPPSITNASAPGPLSSSSGVSHFLLGMPLLHQPSWLPPLLLLPFFQCVGIFGPPLFPLLFSLSEFTSFGFFTAMVVSLRRESGCLWSILLDFLTLPVPWRCSSTGFGFTCTCFSFRLD